MPDPNDPWTRPLPEPLDPLALPPSPLSLTDWEYKPIRAYLAARDRDERDDRRILIEILGTLLWIDDKLAKILDRQSKS